MSEGAVTRSGLGRLGVAALLACLAFAYFSAFRTYGINLPDEGTLLHKYQRFGEGDRLYADFHAGYTPGVYYVHGLLQSWFDQSIIPGRIALALTNSLAVALLYLLAAPLCGTAFAVVGALLYPAFMPLHPGHFASFNVPYPTWYSVTVFLVGLLIAREFLRKPRPYLALLSGACAGLGFLFKPNIGAFQLASAMLIVLAATPRRANESALGAVWWWAVWLSVLGGVVAVFGGVPSAIELRTLVAPVVAVGLVCALHAGIAKAPATLSRVVVPTLLVIAGFLAVSLSWLVYYARELPLDRLLDDVLFVGSDYAQFFAKTHPLVLQRAIVLVFVFLALHGIPSWLRARGLRPLNVALFSIIVVGVAAVMLLVRRPMVLGFGASVMSALEDVWAYAAALAVLWLLIAFAARSVSRNHGFVVLAVGAALLYPAIYPRTDFSHWVWAAPVAMVGGLVLLSSLAWAWSAGESMTARLLLGGTCLAPLVLIGGLRIATALEAAYHLEDTTIVRRPLAELDNKRAPVWINIGRAASYREIENLVEAVRRVTEPAEPVLTFPALDFALFFSGRRSPLRNSYFFPRFVGHDDEAIAVWTMEAHPPRFAVILYDDWEYFEDTPAYYFLLADFVEREYRPFLRIGRYALLAHRSVSVQPPRDLALEAGAPDPRVVKHVTAQLQGGGADGLRRALGELRYDVIEGYSAPLTNLLRHESPDVRAAAVSALRFAGDEETANALFTGVVNGEIPEPSRKLALRLAGAWGGPASIKTMIAHVDDADPEIVDAARSGLQHYANRELRASFWFGSDSARGHLESAFSFGNRERLAIRSWFRDTRADPRLKLFAIAVADRVGAYDEIVHAITSGCDAVEVDAACRLTWPASEVEVARGAERQAAGVVDLAIDPRPWHEVACLPDTLATRFRGATAAISDSSLPTSRILLGLATSRLAPMTLPVALDLMADDLDAVRAAQLSAQTQSDADATSAADIYASRAARVSAKTHPAADATFAAAFSVYADAQQRADILWLASIEAGERMRGIARDLLNDPNPVIRAAAIGLLGRTGSAELLCSAENDSNGQVRTLARLACEKLASTNENDRVR